MPSTTRQTVYRRPVSQISVEQVGAKLREMERSFRTRWIGLMALGALTTMFGPVLIGSGMWGAQFNARVPGPIHSWITMVGRVAIVMLPILFGLEWLTRGKLFEETAESMSDLSGFSRFAMGRGMLGMMFIEVCLWGPRMVIAGTKRIVGQSKHEGADRAVAAAIVHALVLSDSSKATGELFPLAGGRDDVFGDALAFLLFFDVIGISKTGDRTWLCSDAQRALKLQIKQTLRPMRMIGTIPSDTDAERFSDYLVTQKIPNMLEQPIEGKPWEVWVESDDDLDRAKSELAKFLQSSGDAKYDAASAADRIREEEQKKQIKRRARIIDYRTQSLSGRPSFPTVTIALITLSLVISIATNSLNLGGKARQQMIDYVRFTPANLQTYGRWLDQTGGDFHEAKTVVRYWWSYISAGQVWRVVSPIFIHYGVFHLIFNLFWLRDLGMMIETRRGSLRFLGLVLACALIGNFAEAAWELPHLASFGGMSGVVYGLFGYIWVKQKFEPHLGMGIAHQTAWIMIAWLFICMTGQVGPVANAAHVVGLLTGAVIAYGPRAWLQITRSA